MARIFTPSERSRRSVNPQPVSSGPSDIFRSKYLVLLKNVFGAPLPILWIAFGLSLFVGYSVHSLIILAITVCTAFYVALDRFSHSREFQFFSLGIEIPAFLVSLVLVVSSVFNDSGILSPAVTGWISWLGVLYLLTYSLNLFPGLNRLFWSFVLGAFGYTALSIWQFYQGNNLLWVGQPTNLFDLYRAGSSFLISAHGFVSAMICIYCLSFFAFKKRKMSLSGLLFAVLLGLSIASVFIGQKLIFFSAFIVPFLYYTLFISRKSLRDTGLVAVAFGLIWMGVQKIPNLDSNLGLDEQFSEMELKKDYWRDRFSSFDEHIWLGKPIVLNPISLHEGKLNEDQIFNFESNYYLLMLSSQGIFLFIAMILFFIFSLFRSMALFRDIPTTHHWHKIFVFFAINAQIMFFVSFMALTPWYSSQVLSIMLMIYSVVFYMSDAYTKQIVPDDHSL